MVDDDLGAEQLAALRQRIVELERENRDWGVTNAQIDSAHAERDRALAAARELRDVVDDVNCWCDATDNGQCARCVVLARTAWLAAPEEHP